ncbi:MAG: NADH-quinone oxidoreductase subunit NuoH [Actinobacteria bacterium]|nr:MAG: NADH-quinone oxidoreductase subunit NuoH [Actinomycetota bacterium]
MSILLSLAGVVAIVIVVMINTIVVMYMERKVLAHVQSRLGPMVTGWHGVLQPIADAVKLLAKEDLIPAQADRLLFWLAPVMSFVPAVLVYIAMPWTGMLGVELDVGIFLVFGVAALFPVGLLVAGWASHNKYSLLGGFRAAAQQVSYEVPMLMSVMGVVMLTGSMKLSAIVEAQSPIWHVFTQPLALLLYVIGILAELNRVPFDMPEAESELVGGFNVEYSSMRFALFFVAEYVNMFTLSLLGAMLFFGGWGADPSYGWVVLMAKTYTIVLFIIVTRGTLPRIRVDQLMSVGWKLLVPAAILNVFLTAVGIVVGTPALVALEWAAAALFVLIVIRVSGRTSPAASKAAAGEVAA